MLSRLQNVTSNFNVTSWSRQENERQKLMSNIKCQRPIDDNLPFKLHSSTFFNLTSSHISNKIPRNSSTMRYPKVHMATQFNRSQNKTPRASKMGVLNSARS